MHCLRKNAARAGGGVASLRNRPYKNRMANCTYRHYVLLVRGVIVLSMDTYVCRWAFGYIQDGVDLSKTYQGHADDRTRKYYSFTVALILQSHAGCVLRSRST